MIVAGFGFRAQASADSLRSALARSGMADRVSCLATAADKAESNAFVALMEDLNLPVQGILPDDLAGADTQTESLRVRGMRRTGSVAEAAALVAAGPGGQLLSTRVISDDRMATCAIASATMPGDSP